MVEPVNFQHTLPRTQLADKMHESAKDQHIGDRQAFAAELDTLEKVRDKQVEDADHDQDRANIRDGGQQGASDEDLSDEDEAREFDESAAALADEVPDDPEHHIDITA